jgi:hypothetical protein
VVELKSLDVLNKEIGTCKGNTRFDKEMDERAWMKEGLGG